MSDNAKLVLELARYAMNARSDSNLSLRHWEQNRFEADRQLAKEFWSVYLAYAKSARLAARTLFGRELRLPGDR